MKILIACEKSGAVRDAFIKLGHDAISCDMQPSDSDFGPHYQGDVRDLLDYPFDMMIAHPPCTHIAVSGSRHFEKKIHDGRQHAAVSFFMMLAKCDIPRIAIENPVCIMSSLWRKPDQIIQPWQFGEEAQKTTCLWLKGLPPLKHTNIVNKGEFVVSPSGKRMPKWYSNAKFSDRSNIRSKTFQGIADAMAMQWGGDVRQGEQEDLFGGAA
ncbi:DNA cytosine methyltransferase [Acinetobacter sp. FDAARGOS_724]|uniref:DNA cytosine methyltransferase n=1 Tax=Acinetobacter sp. FDAARGOS_724 TaxID=2545797 RepID=UPI00158DDA31|nr:DNA cytosine methyltransferase [Acinetobacter sp. FDAARGOS_724]QKW83413.1 DNA cytosine methyltransferase [Acinetobacter sp. FDAARGOS_724]